MTRKPASAMDLREWRHKFVTGRLTAENCLDILYRIHCTVDANDQCCCADVKQILMLFGIDYLDPADIDRCEGCGASPDEECQCDSAEEERVIEAREDSYGA